MKYTKTATIIILLLLITSLIFIHYYDSNTIYYYNSTSHFSTINILAAKGYNNSYYSIIFDHSIIPISVLYISSSSLISPSNNISINASLIDIYSLLRNINANINSSTINLYYNGNLIIIPVLVIYTSLVNNESVYDSVNLILSEGHSTHDIPLVSNHKLVTSNYTVPVTPGLATLNVSWSINSNYLLYSPFFYEELEVIFNYGGAYYVYFWNINITSTT
ncbi:hypothetical protein DFR86_11115 [Acidianus sulfidivorans JP7]|uniref:Uncharacterized protein n=1 Tax=Acidianus sulfidivorans JP7 TaxID=619593 RepID=A0A2U9IPQ0_9CREN|nr:hypothetical protein [Acidianus sulfidivorans]AWR98029.1 hypothetical protein DFR86_11115 [Acidianus sulfidivorans JP7]